MIDPNIIKKDFPLFSHKPNLAYLDSSATSLKSKSVIEKITEYYSEYSANIFRGVYDISEKATAEYEETRTVIKDFIHAPSSDEIIFTRGTTESINLFVNGMKDFLKERDEIVTTISEHHSNFVPWQQLSINNKHIFTVIVDLDLSSLNWTDYISDQTKVVAITYVSNVLGTINPIKKIVSEIKKINPRCIVFVDGAQAVPHMSIDVQDLGCDAFAFSSHKMLGPTGVGVLWVKKELLEVFKPYHYGGDMIKSVSIENTEYADLPHRFEAGTPHIAGVIALKEAVTYLNKVGLDAIHSHEIELSQYCYDSLQKEFGEMISLIGPTKRETGIVAFSMKTIHAHDIAQVLNEDSIAVRAGHHCTMPLHTHLNLEASVRASFYLYNTRNDVERLIISLKKVVSLFSK